MLLSPLHAQSFKDLPKKYQMVIFEKFKVEFNYKSKRRFNQILLQEVHPTPDEHIFLTNKISEFSAFFLATSDTNTTEKVSFIQIFQ
ncbi:MAG: hypothetical protein ACK4UP_05490 [Spirosomataceae bacterium]